MKTFIIEIIAEDDAEAEVRDIASQAAQAIGYDKPVTESTDAWSVTLIDASSGAVYDQWGG